MPSLTRPLLLGPVRPGRLVSLLPLRPPLQLSSWTLDPPHHSLSLWLRWGPIPGPLSPLPSPRSLGPSPGFLSPFPPSSLSSGIVHTMFTLHLYLLSSEFLNVSTFKSKTLVSAPFKSLSFFLIHWASKIYQTVEAKTLKSPMTPLPFLPHIQSTSIATQRDTQAASWLWISLTLLTAVADASLFASPFWPIVYTVSICHIALLLET